MSLFDFDGIIPEEMTKELSDRQSDFPSLYKHTELLRVKLHFQ